MLGMNAIAFHPWSYGRRNFDCLMELNFDGCHRTPFHDWLDSIDCAGVKNYIGCDGTLILLEPGVELPPLSAMAVRIMNAFLWHVEEFKLREIQLPVAENGAVVIGGSAVISDSEMDYDCDTENDDDSVALHYSTEY